MIVTHDGRRRCRPGTQVGPVRPAFGTVSYRVTLPLSIAFLIGFALLMTPSSAKPDASINEDALLDLCRRIPDQSNPGSDRAIIQLIRDLFPAFAARITYSDPPLSVQLFLSERKALRPSTSCAILPCFRAPSQYDDDHPVSASATGAQRIAFVRELIDTDLGDGVQAAFAAALMCVMPSAELGTFTTSPDTLLLKLLERTLHLTPTTRWPLLPLYRRIVDRMTSEALAVDEYGALMLIYEEGIQKLFERRSSETSSPIAFDLIRLFHRVSALAPTDMVDRMARDLAHRFPAEGALWARVFIAYLYPSLSEEVGSVACQDRFDVATVLRDTAKRFDAEAFRFDLGMQVVLRAGRLSVTDLASVLLGEKLPGSQYVEYRSWRNPKTIPFEMYVANDLKQLSSEKFSSLALNHFHMNGIIDAVFDKVLPQLKKSGHQNLYMALAQNYPDFAYRITDTDCLRQIGPVIQSHFCRLHSCPTCPSSYSNWKSIPVPELHQRILALADGPGQYDRRLPPVLVQILFRFSLSDAFCVSVVASPNWNPSRANLALLWDALVTSPSTGTFTADLVRALLGRADVLAQLEEGPASGLIRVLGRRHSSAALDDWLTELRDVNAYASVARLAELRVEVASDSEPDPVCRDLIQALLDRFGSSSDLMTELRLVLIELYLRVPRTSLSGLSAVLPLRAADWATLIEDPRWHPSLEHLSDLNDLLACWTTPDPACSRILHLLIRVRTPQVAASLVDSAADPIYHQLLLHAIRCAVDVDFAALVAHAHWPPALSPHVVTDRRWTPTEANVDALRHAFSRDSSPLPVCGDLLQRLLDLDAVRHRLRTVHPGPQPLRHLFIWLYLRAPSTVRVALKAHPQWSPHEDWPLLIADPIWRPTQSTVAALRTALGAQHVQRAGRVLRGLLRRSEVRAALSENSDLSRDLRAVLIGLPALDPDPNWAPLFAVPYWSASEWLLLVGKPNWTAASDHVTALRRSIPSDRSDSEWAPVLVSLLQKSDIEALLNGSSSSNENLVQDLIASLSACLPATEADAVRDQFPHYRQWLNPIIERRDESDSIASRPSY